MLKSRPTKLHHDWRRNNDNVNYVDWTGSPVPHTGTGCLYTGCTGHSRVFHGCCEVAYNNLRHSRHCGIHIIENLWWTKNKTGSGEAIVHLPVRPFFPSDTIKILSNYVENHSRWQRSDIYEAFPDTWKPAIVAPYLRNLYFLHPDILASHDGAYLVSCHCNSPFAVS